MGKTAFLFPGQGSQYVGMGERLYHGFPSARNVYDQASNLLAIDLTELCFRGPEEKLNETRYTQPAVFVTSVALSSVLKTEQIVPDLVAGHSLGEYSALVQAGVLEFPDALEAVQIRAELMQHVEEQNPGKMTAIIGLSPEEVCQICETVSCSGLAVPANFNSSEQIVISGEAEAVTEAAKLAQERGARKVIQLQVRGASHTPLMKPVADKLEQVLSNLLFKEAQIPIISNVTAAETTDPDEIRQLLVKHLTHPVKWSQSMQRMIALGVDKTVEVGPGKVLRGLTRKIDRSVQALSAEELVWPISA